MYCVILCALAVLLASNNDKPKFPIESEYIWTSLEVIRVLIVLKLFPLAFQQLYVFFSLIGLVKGSHIRCTKYTKHNVHRFSMSNSLVIGSATFKTTTQQHLGRDSDGQFRISVSMPLILAHIFSQCLQTVCFLAWSTQTATTLREPASNDRLCVIHPSSGPGWMDLLS